MLITAAFSLPAAAQTTPGDQPAWQLYGGTSFLWAKTRDQLSPYNLSTINEWGWQTDITEYPWHWFGGTLESSGFYGRPTVFDPATGQNYGNLLNLKSYTIMFGPTFTYTHSYRVQPFGHVLLGGVNSQCTNMHSYQACQLINGQPGNYSQWIFGWALGGGADVRVSRLVAIRGQFDWLPTTFNNLYNDRQNNLRVSVGLVFRFGGTDSTRSQLKPPPPVPPSNSSGDMSSNSVPAAPQPGAQQSQPVTAVAQQILSPTPIAPPVNTPPGTPQVNTAPAASQAQVAKAAPPVMSTPASASAPPAQTQAAVKEQDAPPPQRADDAEPGA